MKMFNHLLILACLDLFSLSSEVIKSGAESNKLTTKIFFRTYQIHESDLKGTEIAKVYSSLRETLYCYKDYYVTMGFEPVNGADLINIYKRHDQLNQDSVIISSNDTSLFHVATFGSWFFGLKDSYVFIDEGCCPGLRDLWVYDLAKGDTILITDYSNFPDVPYVDSLLSLVYWEPVGPADSTNCPRYNEIVEENFIPNIIHRCAFNLLKRSKALLKQTDCIEEEIEYHKFQN